MNNTPVSYISNIAVFIAGIISVNMILTPKMHSFITIMIGIIIGLLRQLPHFSLLSLKSVFIINIILYCLFVQLFYAEKRSGKLFLSLFLSLPAVFSRHITFILRNITESSDIPSQVLFLFVYLLLLIPRVMLARKHKQIYTAFLQDRDFILLCFFPLCQLFILFFSNSNTSAPLYAVSALAVCLFTELIMIHQMNQAVSLARLRLRSDTIENLFSVRRQNDLQQSGYLSLAKLRHDINNHLLTMQALLDNGKHENAEKYLDTVKETYNNTTHFPACMNSVTAIYLEKKYEDLSQKGISVIPDVCLPDKLLISDPDLICIYGNLLDNAAEACSTLSNSEIILNTVYQYPYLTISCSNPVTISTDKKQRIPGLKRGTGFMILSDIADKYDGHFSNSVKDNTFYTEIVLKVRPEVDNAENCSM